VRAALTVGLCGGFTTFSAFSVEVVTLLQAGRPGRAVVYVLASVVAGVAAAWTALR
jgi:CrcB protein